MQKNTYKPDMTAELARCSDFLRNFSNSSNQLQYMELLALIKERTVSTMEIYVEDLQVFFSSRVEDMHLMQSMMQNTRHYLKLFYKAADEILRDIPSNNDYQDTPQDVLLQQRLIHGNEDAIPDELKRRYEIAIVYRGEDNAHVPLREVGAPHIGALVNVNGIVTRVSEVKPYINVACYLCDVCGYELFQTIGGTNFNPIVVCPSRVCAQNQSQGKLFPQTRGSKFTPYQDIKIQEPADQVPIGHVPRMMTVLAYGQSTRKCSPGDLVTVTGIYLPEPYEGFKAIRSGLIHNTFLEAYKFVRHKKSYRENLISNEMVQRINKERSQTNIYDRLAKSIAPEIYGMEDVKKSLLLLLTGGVTKEMKDGMKIRGDINVLLMGDPGVGKSQLLKHISKLAPRGIYTTGKGSSGVGLTAAVLKDPVTNDLVLEAGALVLADTGICCIDEFDKMDERDRTSIHEVMEQQTVSIAKAGITTTLNARTSILAAANPLYGRYNKKMSPQANINLPAALLSRFDVVFLLLDEANVVGDELLARHVTFVHQNGVHPEQQFEALDANFMRAYIAEAKRWNPIIPKDLKNYIVRQYAEKRTEQKEETREGYAYVTPRTLLGIIRLSQGLARLRLDDIVNQEDVDEALRLMDVSRNTINEDGSKQRKKNDPQAQIFALIRNECRHAVEKSVRYDIIERQVLSMGLSVENLQQCLDNYSEKDVFFVSSDRNAITLIS